jgi:hypothetical protein
VCVPLILTRWICRANIFAGPELPDEDFPSRWQEGQPIAASQPAAPIPQPDGDPRSTTASHNHLRTMAQPAAPSDPSSQANEVVFPPEEVTTESLVCDLIQEVRDAQILDLRRNMESAEGDDLRALQRTLEYLTSDQDSASSPPPPSSPRHGREEGSWRA